MLFSKRCAKAEIEISMGSVGDCYDNAVCETFHATLKKEKIYRQSWPTRAAARTAVFEYIEGWYNPRRRHSTLAYLSPAQFERQHAELELPIQTNRSVAGTSPTSLDGLTTRRISPVGLDLVPNRPISPDNALKDRTAIRQDRDERLSRDHCNRWSLHSTDTGQAR